MRDFIGGLAQRVIDGIWDIPGYGSTKSRPRPLLVAHRGAWGVGVIENTLKAFTRAGELGAWAVEFDVRFTRDGVPVVHHDATLLRCHGRTEAVEDLSAAELKALAPAVPTLEEALSLSRLHFMIEIKTPMKASHAEVLDRLLGRLRPVEDYHLLALSSDLVGLSERRPPAAWVLVGEVFTGAPMADVRTRALGGFACHYVAMTRRLIDELHAAGRKVGTGFAPSRNLFVREWARGVDWVFTNHLARILELDGSRRSP